jgi:hypothetical protein
MKKRIKKKKKVENLNDDEWEKLRDISKVLKHFEYITKFLSKGRYPTITSILSTK